MIAPVEALIVSPAPAEKVPPVEPVSVGLCAVATEVQKGLPAYEIVEEGAVVIVTVTGSLVVLSHPPTV